MSGKKELKLGLIGVGGRGSLARLAHKPEQGVRVVAGADVEDSCAELMTENFGPETVFTRDYRELLANPELDAVFITTPDFLHEEMAIAALTAGKDVYLEKPMAITIEGCDRILKAAFEHRRILYLGHNMRHMDFTKKMKALIDGGAIGEVKAGWCRHFINYGGDAYFKDWHAERKNVTSLLLQKGAHDIDILHWLCGGYTTRVHAMGGLTVYDQVTDRRGEDEPWDDSWQVSHWPPLAQTGLNPKIDVEDLSNVNMQLDNGVICTYMQCHFTPDSWRNYTIIGTEGRVENFQTANHEGVVLLWNKRVEAHNPDGDEQYPMPKQDGSHGGVRSQDCPGICGDPSR